uniref:Uncharacterized protein n=1 Tax=Cacopsylla melanoneura TaxID=428564 RepID=A0A8D9F2X4_9HEMI
MCPHARKLSLLKIYALFTYSSMGKIQFHFIIKSIEEPQLLNIKEVISKNQVSRTHDLWFGRRTAVIIGGNVNGPRSRGSPRRTSISSSKNQPNSRTWCSHSDSYKRLSDSVS